MAVTQASTSSPRVGYRSEPPYLDEHRPGHRHGSRRTAEALTDLGKDAADEAAVEATEGRLIPVRDPLDKITKRFGDRREVDLRSRHPILPMVYLRSGHHQGLGRLLYAPHRTVTECAGSADYENPAVRVLTDFRWTAACCHAEAADQGKVGVAGRAGSEEV
jgi:hypothetical protein